MASSDTNITTRKTLIASGFNSYVLLSLVLVIPGLLFITNYQKPTGPLAVLYTYSAFITHLFTFALAPFFG